MQWVNAGESFPGNKAVLKLIVTNRDGVVDGALVTSRISFDADGKIHSQSMSEPDGKVDIEIELPPPTGAETPVLIRAAADDKSVTRKFRIKRT